MAPATIIVDDSDWNADWIKTLAWDLPTDPDELTDLFGERWWERLSRLPAWQAAPLSVKMAVPAQIVKFAPGLRPVLKHLQGQHDQMKHGKGGGSEGGAFSEWGDRAERLRVAANRGPSEGTLDSLADGTYLDEAAASNIDGSGIVESMLEGEMESWLEVNDVEDYSEAELDAVREEKGIAIRRSLIDEEKERISYDDEYLRDSFDEVFAVEHTGVTRDGRTLTLTTRVDSVSIAEYPGRGAVQVSGSINDENGNQIGEFQRVFYRGRETGELEVSHEYMKIYDEDDQGTGFAKTFNANAEDYYISHGINTIRIHAALDGGGYAWAKQGFDWADPSHDSMGSALSRMTAIADGSPVRTSVGSDWTTYTPSPAESRQARRLVDRAALSIDDPDYPTPYEFAMLGYVPGDSAWVGQAVMRGADWMGTKTLTPQGRRRSESEMNPTGTAPLPFS